MSLPRIQTASLRSTQFAPETQTLTLGSESARRVEHRAGQHGIWRLLALGLLAGGLARWASVLVAGTPGPLTLAQAVVEVVVSIVVLVLVRGQAASDRAK